MAAPSEPKKKPRSVSEHQEERPKAITIIGQRGLETMLLQKYGLYRVKLSFSLLPQTRFFGLGSMSVSPKGALGRAQELPGGHSEISGGARVPKKGPERSPRGGLEEPSGAQKWQEHDTEIAISKTVKRRWFS